MRLRWPFGRKSNVSPELRHSIASGWGEGAGRSGDTLSEEMRKAEDATNYNLVHDDVVSSLLRQMYGLSNDPFIAGLIVRDSPLVAQSWIDPFIADTKKLINDRDLEEVQCDMEREDWESGYQFFMDSMKLKIDNAFDDSKKGHKPQLIKSRTLHQRLGLGSSDEEKGTKGF